MAVSMLKSTALRLNEALEVTLTIFQRVFKSFFSFFLSVFSVGTASFFLVRLLPGGPFSSERHLSAEIIASLEAKYHLDRSVFEQYFIYISKLFTKLDFGPSLKYPNRDVLDLLLDAMPVSLTLGVIAFLFAVVIGVSLGILLAYLQKQNYSNF